MQETPNSTSHRRPLQIRIPQHNRARLTPQLRNDRLEILPRRRRHNRPDRSAAREINLLDSRMRDQRVGYLGSVLGPMEDEV
jgi:hypothetical protein